MLKKLLIIMAIFCTAGLLLAATTAGQCVAVDRVAQKMRAGLYTFNKLPDILTNRNNTNTLARMEAGMKSSYGVEDGDESLYDGLQFATELSYKVYTLNNENVVTEYEQVGNFSDIISEDYMVYTPLRNRAGEVVGLVSFVNIDGAMVLQSYKKMPENQAVFYQNNEILKLLTNDVAVTAYSGEEIVSVKAAVLNQYYTIVLCVTTTNGEYVLPISSSELLTALQEKELYTTEEFINALAITSRESEGQTKSGEIVYGKAA